jgi:photosystem II stability/assembly factor-like uncharacterized protein
MKSREEQITRSVLVATLGFSIGLTDAFPQGVQTQQPSQPEDVQDVEERSIGLVIPTPDASVRYRLAGGGFVERTADGGATWDGQLVSPNAKLNAGAAPDARVCWLVGREGRIFLTRDGTNWTKIPAPAQLDFVAITAKNGSSATVTSLDKRRFSTVNRGKTWRPVS